MKFVLIADSHIDEEHGRDQFFAMLSRCARMPDNCAIVFLGDIFELWFAVQNYESEEHLRFIQWCQEQTKHRTVVFLEGNHEFYVSKKHRQAFTFAADSAWHCGNLMFSHGDRVNRSDWKYGLLRCGARNNVTRFLLYCVRNWFGPALTHKIRLGLKQANKANKKHFPQVHAEHYLEYLGKRHVLALVIGHFHEGKTLNAGCRLYVLPAWYKEEEIGILDASTLELQTGSWKTLLPAEIS